MKEPPISNIYDLSPSPHHCRHWVLVPSHPSGRGESLGLTLVGPYREESLPQGSGEATITTHMPEPCPPSPIKATPATDLSVFCGPSTEGGDSRSLPENLCNTEEDFTEPPLTFSLLLPFFLLPYPKRLQHYISPNSSIVRGCSRQGGSGSGPPGLCPLGGGGGGNTYPTQKPKWAC